MKKLYIIRHGHPEQNTGIPYDRVPGPPLSARGRREAHEAGQFLAGMCAQFTGDFPCIERLYASPLDRTVGTAQEISAVIGRQFVVDEALAELRTDETFDTIRRRLRGWLAARLGEPVASLAAVTHGSPIKALLLLLSTERIDLSPYSFDSGNHSPTAGIWCATRADDESWQLEFVFKPQTAAVPI